MFKIETDTKLNIDDNNNNHNRKDEISLLDSYSDPDDENIHNYKENETYNAAKTEEDTVNVHKSEKQTFDFVNTLSNEQKNRLEYLLQTTETYSHFIYLKNDEVSVENNNVKETKSKLGNEKICYQFDTHPKYIKSGEMRPYQIQGLNWLISLYENGLNGILADEMGLGKTIQAIALLGYIKYIKKKHLRSIIIVPLTTVQNWFNEFSKWCPSIHVICLPSLNREDRAKIKRKHYIRQCIAPGKWDVCITSYEMCVIEFTALKKFQYNYMIIDEGHKIKNEITLISKTVRLYQTENRLLLTGTPLQNDTHEIWALLNFLMPDVFERMNDFDTWFNVDNCINNKSLLTRLQSILKPFLLRRLKSDVESALLPKIEHKIYVNLSPMQFQLYKDLLTRSILYMKPNGEIIKKGLSMLQQYLRQCANHPYFFPNQEQPPYSMENVLTNSGKMIVLDKLLQKLKIQKSRVLIFTQFHHMITILEDFCTWKNYSYCKITGASTLEDRSTKINDFNAPNSDKFIFLITTRSGGQGINLYTADTVIIYDSDWNPQMDLQAIDRAHRIGQKKQVFVYRLISEHTIEERIQELADLKLQIDRLVIQDGRLTTTKAKNVLIKQREKIVKVCIDKLDEMKDFDNNDDIETILSRAEQKTIEYNAKLNDMVKAALDETPDLSSINDIDDNNESISNRSTRIRKKVIIANPKIIYDFQFFPLPIYEDMYRENILASKPNITVYKLSETVSELDNFRISNYLKRGFANWTEELFNEYINEINLNGARNNNNATKNLSKREFKKYSVVFLNRYYELKNLNINLVKKIFYEIHGDCVEPMRVKFSKSLEPLKDFTITYNKKQFTMENKYFNGDIDIYLLELYFQTNGENFVNLKTKLSTKFPEAKFLSSISANYLEKRCYYLMIHSNIELRQDFSEEIALDEKIEIMGSENKENVTHVTQPLKKRKLNF